MSTTRIVTGTDARGRPQTAWAPVEPEPAPYGFMEPAYSTEVQRRQATPEELEAARAREKTPSHLTRAEGGTPPLLVTRERRMPVEEVEDVGEPVVITSEVPEELTLSGGTDEEPEPFTVDETIEGSLAVLMDAVVTAAEAWGDKQTAEHLADQADVAWLYARRAVDAAYVDWAMRTGHRTDPVAPPIRMLTTWLPIDPHEERLNNLSDRAIGEAMGGEIGAAMVAGAEHNLAVLDEIDPPAVRPATREELVAIDEVEDLVTPLLERARSKKPRQPGHHPSKADEAREKAERARRVMDAMGRLGGDTRAVAAELGMKPNAVAMVVRFAHRRTGATA